VGDGWVMATFQTLKSELLKLIGFELQFFGREMPYFSKSR
jgi:hypothetical protein